MKRRWFNASLLAVIAGTLVACGGGDDPGPVMAVDATGTSTFSAGNLASPAGNLPAGASVARGSGQLGVHAGRGATGA